VSDELIEIALEEAVEKMGNAVVHAKGEFSTVRTGRASPALVEKLPVNYYGSDVPMQQLASFSVPEARQLLITPFDKGSMEALSKAIQNADLGLNPSNDGVVIRLSFPPLTEERRKELVRVVRGMAEDGRVAIRNARRASRHDLEALQKDGDASQDQVQRAEKLLDDRTHASESAIDHSLEAKEVELLEV
jgi:ribosome recycling factor